LIVAVLDGLDEVRVAVVKDDPGALHCCTADSEEFGGLALRLCFN
jgi:hypothetical protein